MQGEEVPGRAPPCEILREGAAQAREGRIAGRRQRAEPVGGAALDDEDEAAVGRRLRDRDLRARRASAAAAPAARGRCGDRHIVHLLRNSGATSSSASPWPGLSARAIACVVAAPSAPGISRGPSWRASIGAAGARRDPLRRLDPAHQRVGPGPARGDVVKAGGRARPPDRLAELVEQAGGGLRLDMARADRAQRGDRPVPGRAELGRRRGPGLGRVDDRAIERRQVAAAAQIGLLQPLAPSPAAARRRRNGGRAWSRDGGRCAGRRRGRAAPRAPAPRPPAGRRGRAMCACPARGCARRRRTRRACRWRR